MRTGGLVKENSFFSPIAAPPPAHYTRCNALGGAGTQLFIAIGSLVVILALVLLLPRLSTKRKVRTPRKKKQPFHCPLCGSLLAEGQKLHTVVYKGSSGAASEERIAHINGCPYCLDPDQGWKRKRTCPVCRRRLGAGDYLIGWLGKTEEGGTIRVAGCSLCKPVHL
jgi:hypothetical protein